MEIDDFADQMAAYEQERYEAIKKHRNDAENHNEGDIANPAEDKVCCPRCGNTQLTANQKGFGIGKAAVGGLLLGPVGLLGGFVGSKKVIITCLKCGYQWKP